MSCTRMRFSGKAVIGNGLGFWCESGKDQVPVCQEIRTDGEICFQLAGLLCDFPITEGSTCDQNMCESHAYDIDYEKHFCHKHVIEYRKFMDENNMEAVLSNVVKFKAKKPI